MDARPLPLVLLALSLALVPAASRGAEKVDLTSYLAVASAVGDFKVFAADNGEERRSETMSVETYGTGRFEIEEYSIDGMPVGAAGALVLPGRRLILVGESIGGLDLRWRSPGVRRPLRLVPGKLTTIRGSGRVLVNGVRTGSVSLRSTLVFGGFADCPTPNAVWLATAQLETTSLIRIRERGRGRSIELSTTASSCYADGVGLIANTEHGRVTIDGILEEDTGEISMHLTGGTRFGVPIDIPPPPP